jgi:hypothetical protein
MYAQGELPVDNRRALERAVQQNDLLSIRSMTSYTGQAELVDLYYGEAYSVVEFMLREWGQPNMRELLQVFAEGTPQEDALQHVYHVGLQDLDAAWRTDLGLGPRAVATPGAAVTEEEPVRDEQPLCGYSLGALLLPIVGGALAVASGRKATGR